MHGLVAFGRNVLSWRDGRAVRRSKGTAGNAPGGRIPLRYK
jgi:hypothetical protein